MAHGLPVLLFIIAHPRKNVNAFERHNKKVTEKP